MVLWFIKVSIHTVCMVALRYKPEMLTHSLS